MRNIQLAMLALASLLVSSVAMGQSRPYIGFVYPAGGQQGTTFEIKLGGQNIDEIQQIHVSGDGVRARLIEYHRKLSPQDMRLLQEQLQELRRGKKRGGGGDDMMDMNSMEGGSSMARTTGGGNNAALIAKIEKRMREYVQRPASNAIAATAIIEVTIARDAKPGRRELSLATIRGVSNPLVFNIGQLPEVNRKPMHTCPFQILGKERLALRKRPTDEAEQTITLPATLNGQIASSEVNSYRFNARKGQRLVFSCDARQLIPFVADAVPGWFQPVMAIYDARGKELAYDDDYRFKPDPVILFEVPKDGEYVLTITDAIYRGREDFVYRITAGELPFLSNIYPIGAEVGTQPNVEMKGWNLDGAKLVLPPSDAGPGKYDAYAQKGNIVSNVVPFQLSTLPEGTEVEPNNDIAKAQKVKFPIIINGRMNRTDDWDVFQVEGKAGETIVAECYGRRLESPMDAFLKVTDASGKPLAFNDDQEDPEAGTNTHDADAYVSFKAPADGTYYIHLGEAARTGGEEYAYRMRISKAMPDFALRIVPSSVTIRLRNNTGVTVKVLRKEGFDGPIKLTLKDPPPGFTASPVVVSGKASEARFIIKGEKGTREPVSLKIEGTAQINGKAVSHLAVAAEDRMQAFLWRHIVPAQDLRAMVFDPSFQPPPKRVARPTPPAKKTGEPPKFTRQQVAGRLRMLKLLFEEGLFTDQFYNDRVAECEAAK